MTMRNTQTKRERNQNKTRAQPHSTQAPSHSSRDGSVECRERKMFDLFDFEERKEKDGRLDEKRRRGNRGRKKSFKKRRTSRRQR